MKRLVVKLTERDFEALEKLAKLRELPLPHLAYTAVARMLDIERKNPRPPIAHPEYDGLESEVDASGKASLQLREGVDDPVESVRLSTVPEHMARLQALAALMTMDEDSAYIPLATQLLAGLLAYVALDPTHLNPRTVETLMILLKSRPSDFEEVIAPAVEKSTVADGFAARQIHRVFRRPRPEREAARDFAADAVRIFFEPALRTEMQQRSIYRHILIVPVPADEYTEFVNFAARMRLSPAALGREAIHRLIGKGRPHLALVQAGHDPATTNEA